MGFIGHGILQADLLNPIVGDAFQHRCHMRHFAEDFCGAGVVPAGRGRPIEPLFNPLCQIADDLVIGP